MRMKIVRGSDENGSPRRPMKIEWKSRSPEQVESIAPARVVGFRPMQMEDIAILIPQQPAPIFAQQPQAAPQQAATQPAPFEQIPQMQMPPIFVPPRKPIDLRNLKAAFQQPSFYGKA